MTPEERVERLTRGSGGRLALLVNDGAAIAEEREANADIATDFCVGVHDGECRPCDIAAAIRSRS